MTTPSTPVADSVRLALPSEAAVIAAFYALFVGMFVSTVSSVLPENDEAKTRVFGPMKPGEV